MTRHGKRPQRGARAAEARNVRPTDEPRLDALFDALRRPGVDGVPATTLRAALADAGLRVEDQRLAVSLQKLDDRERAATTTAGEPVLDRAAFGEVVQGGASLVERVVRRELAIPDFGAFARTVTDVFEAGRAGRGGEVASYIPQLARVAPERYGLGICTVDGQRLALGDAHEPFCVQSSCKPINYCLALQDAGVDVVHRHVGCEPSGRSFNELSLNHEGRPHNPMINAGAIMTCSLLGRHLEPADRFDHVTELWTRLAGGARPGFANAVYLSERRTADRNFALGYSMRESGAFPVGADLHDTLEFYFQCCSLEITADDFAVVAATLANGGVCPLTEERVLAPDVVHKCLTLMQSCGMYDFSGEWAFVVGLPAKSGVSGVIFVVIPNVLGLCVWSPPLDRVGNSVRGVSFCRELVRRFDVQPFGRLGPSFAARADDVASTHVGGERAAALAELLWAASKDDVHGVRRAVARGQSLDEADYDGRTALHVAASEGCVDVLRDLLARGVKLAPRDRWGGTPIDDAKREGRTDAVALLESAAGAGRPTRATA